MPRWDNHRARRVAPATMEVKMARGWTCVAVAVVLCGSAAPAWATFPGGNGSIVYGWFGGSVYRGGASATSIRAVDPTSGIFRVLRDCPLRFGPSAYTDCSVGSPRSSPDGQTIAFANVRTTPDFEGGPWQSRAWHRHDGAGRDRPRRARHPAQVLDVRLGAVRRPAPAHAGSAGVGLSHSRRRSSSPRSTERAEPVAPVWSSDADWSSRGQIAYVRDRNADPTCRRRSCRDLFLTRLGRAPRRLTYRGGSSPSWSPHGTELAFVGNARSGRAGIYTVRRRRHRPAPPHEPRLGPGLVPGRRVDRLHSLSRSLRDSHQRPGAAPPRGLAVQRVGLSLRRERRLAERSAALRPPRRAALAFHAKHQCQARRLRAIASRETQKSRSVTPRPRFGWQPKAARWQGPR